MAKDIGATANEAYLLVDKALSEAGIEFKRSGLRYDCPNFSACFEKVVAAANGALKGAPYYAQEMPYGEIKALRPEHMLVLHCEDHQ